MNWDSIFWLLLTFSFTPFLGKFCLSNLRYIEIYSLSLIPVIYGLYIVRSIILSRKEKHFTDENLTLTDIYLPLVPNDNMINVTRLLWFELWRPQNSFFKNLIIFPVKIIYVLTLPYESNPLILFCSQYIVIFFGLTIMFYISFSLLDFSVFLAPIVSFSILFILMCLRLVRRFKQHEGLVINILCFAISTSFNYLCIQILKDLSLFIGFQLQYFL